MSEEREILKKILLLYRKDNSCMSWGVARDIEYLLAQPEQTEQDPLSEATINHYLERLGSHFKWDDGFEAGVKWAEKAHGIGVDDE
jgi:hypothetical protein